jgi:hypothetical protein
LRPIGARKGDATTSGSSSSRATLDGYIDEVENRGHDAILMVDEHAPHLAEAALARGLTAAGQVPVMVWRDATLAWTTGYA